MLQKCCCRLLGTELSRWKRSENAVNLVAISLSFNNILIYSVGASILTHYCCFTSDKVLVTVLLAYYL